jgi:TonB family protein
MKRRVLPACLFLLAFSGIQVFTQQVFTQQVFAQSESSQAKLIHGGVLNGKATSLPKPKYPPAALAAGAGGVVNVQVIIGETGNVISAEAVSGHPLLRTAAVDAAKQAKFGPTMADGPPVRVSGILVYNFGSISPFSWRTAGFEMAAAGRAAQLPVKFPAASLDALVPDDWYSERKEVLKLRALQQALTTSGEAKGKVTTYGGNYDLATVDHKQVLNSLRESFESRLRGEQNDLWNFKLGSVLGKMSARIDDKDVLRSGIREIQLLRSSAPGGLAKSLSVFDEFAGNNTFSAEERARIKETIEKFRVN